METRPHQSRAALGRAASDEHSQHDARNATRRALIGAAFAAPLALAASRAMWEVLEGDEARAQDKPNTRKDGPHKLPPLPYSSSALNEAIDSKTMRVHHDKHHKKYVDDLNLAVVRLPAAMRDDTPQSLIMNLAGIADEETRQKVRNSGGGHVNHSMFWSIMSPAGGGTPRGEIGQLITANFGSFDRFKAGFNTAGLKRFGSGWVWLAADKKGAVKIITTPNQDNPLMMGMFPIMGNDVWEHAYYLRYQNRRADYLKAWWNVVNWDAINARIRFMQSSWMKA